MSKVTSANDLPADFGKISGEDHPDTVVARVNWNLAIEAAARSAQTMAVCYHEAAIGKAIADGIRALSRPTAGDEGSEALKRIAEQKTTAEMDNPGLRAHLHQVSENR